MWRWKHGGKEKPSKISRESFAKWAGECVELVYEKTGVKLDYSLESLKTLDATVCTLKPEDQEELQSELLGAYIVLTGSYLGEVVVRSLNGKWEKTDSPLGWVVKLGLKEIDVFQIAFESVSQPDRFSRFHSELNQEKIQVEVKPEALSELEGLIVKGYTTEVEVPEKERPPWEEMLEEDYEY
ncbi:MAG: DUF6278 family protein [Crenarchaeota archaeon]|nr:DUF6278 family protein [Thermoproteota archaeon]